MKKHKNKIITVAVIIAVLAAAWFYGGNYNKPGGEHTTGAVAQGASSPGNGISGEKVSDDGAPEAGIGEPNDGGTNAAPSGGTETSLIKPGPPSPAAGDGEASSEPGKPAPPSNGGAVSSGPGGGDGTGSPDTVNANDKPEPPNSPDGSGSAGMSPSEAPGAAGAVPGANPGPGQVQGPENEPDKTHTQDTAPITSDPGAEADQYQTQPAPDGKPAPVEPQDVTVGDGSFTVYLKVCADNILGNMNLLNKEKHELVPGDGVIFPTAAVIAYEGESVFNVLQREMRRNKIHMVSRSTPIYNSAFIEAINNLYEFDAGELSGWMYCVNEWYPNYGCSRYMLQPGDVIEWHYTCDLGRDLPGANWAVAGQRQ